MIDRSVVHGSADDSDDRFDDDSDDRFDDDSEDRFDDDSDDRFLMTTAHRHVVV